MRQSHQRHAITVIGTSAEIAAAVSEAIRRKTDGTLLAGDASGSAVHGAAFRTDIQLSTSRVHRSSSAPSD